MQSGTQTVQRAKIGQELYDLAIFSFQIDVVACSFSSSSSSSVNSKSSNHRWLYRDRLQIHLCRTQAAKQKSISKRCISLAGCCCQLLAFQLHTFYPFYSFYVDFFSRSSFALCLSLFSFAARPCFSGSCSCVAAAATLMK